MVELAVVDAVVPQDVVVLAQGRRDELVVADGFPHLGDVVVGGGTHSPAGQHEVELASETVSLQDVGHGGAARLVNLSPPAAQWSGRVEDNKTLVSQSGWKTTRHWSVSQGGRQDTGQSGMVEHNKTLVSQSGWNTTRYWSATLEEMTMVGHTDT